ncbi:hypothetical protein K470DRAFT_199752, partial [Piedraia hortae CBS 480.64]
ADSSSSSEADDNVATNVLLGYASKEPTSDEFSRLGGTPTWLHNEPPSGALVECPVCHELMTLLLQLNGDLPARFPNHDRRLYLWTCKRKACRRKEGSVRGFRAVREDESAEAVSKPKEERVLNLGESLFGSNAGRPQGLSSNSNPFSGSNPFASASSLAAKPAQKPSSDSFAKVAGTGLPKPEPAIVKPWPEASNFPTPYPQYHLDAETEYLDTDPAAAAAAAIPSGVRVDGSEGGSDDKTLFESSMDKTFQRFADRLAQNPEQVLRYEYDGQPLLYSRNDAVGKNIFPHGGSRIPGCKNCGMKRVFELQLTPHAITELEVEEEGLDGMDWGTIILGVCSKDCAQKGVEKGKVGYLEEWVGVQWEEV